MYSSVTNLVVSMYFQIMRTAKVSIRGTRTSTSKKSQRNLKERNNIYENLSHFRRLIDTAAVKHNETSFERKLNPRKNNILSHFYRSHIPQGCGGHFTRLYVKKSVKISHVT